MSVTNGALAALVIQEISKDFKDQKERDLREALKKVIREVFQCPPGVELPERLVNGFMRGRKVSLISPEALGRIVDALGSLSYEILASGDSKANYPTWIVKMAKGERGNFDETEVDLEVKSLMDIVFRNIDVEEARSEANAARNQASFVKSVCRILYTNWIEEAASHGLHKSSLINQQKTLLNFPVESNSELQHWSNMIFDAFETTADKTARANLSEFRIASPQAIRTYRNAWHTLVKSRGTEIISNMSTLANQIETTDETFSNKFYSLKFDSHRMKSRSRGQDRAESIGQFDTSENVITNRNLYMSSESLSDQFTRVNEFHSSIPDIAPTQIRASATEKTSARNVVSIEVRFEDGDGSQQRIALSWPDLNKAISSLASWFNTYKPIIGSHLVDYASINIDSNGISTNLEVSNKSLTEIEDYFIANITLPFYRDGQI